MMGADGAVRVPLPGGKRRIRIEACATTRIELTPELALAIRKAA